jgi:hypothetical protein
VGKTLKGKKARRQEGSQIGSYHAIGSGIGRAETPIDKSRLRYVWKFLLAFLPFAFGRVPFCV